MIQDEKSRTAEEKVPLQSIVVQVAVEWMTNPITESKAVAGLPLLNLPQPTCHIC